MSIINDENLQTFSDEFKSKLASVAIDGEYSSLKNTPTIPSPTAVKGNAESTYRTGNVNITPDNLGLAAVSTSGSYDDLSDKPDIPVVDSAISSTSSNPVRNSTIYSQLSGKRTTGSFNTANDTVQFYNKDGVMPDSNYYQEPSYMYSGMTHAQLFNILSMVVSNVRYMWKRFAKTVKDQVYNDSYNFDATSEIILEPNSPTGSSSNRARISFYVETIRTRKLTGATTVYEGTSYIDREGYHGTLVGDVNLQDHITVTDEYGLDYQGATFNTFVTVPSGGEWAAGTYRMRVIKGVVVEWSKVS